MLIGEGGYGQSVTEAAELNGQFEVVGFRDDALAVGSMVLGYCVLGSAAERDWLFVRDHCSAIRRVLEAGRLGETYNVEREAER